jgi:hypothetical protein
VDMAAMHLSDKLAYQAADGRSSRFHTNTEPSEFDEDRYRNLTDELQARTVPQCQTTLQGPRRRGVIRGRRRQWDLRRRLHAQDRRAGDPPGGLLRAGRRHPEQGLRCTYTHANNHRDALIDRWIPCITFLSR